MLETTIVHDWKEFLNVFPEPFSNVYRGQSNFEWELETSLYRMVNQNHAGLNNEFEFEDRLHAERMSLKTFKARAHFYLKNLPKNSDSISWLSTMQHHGAPTRLLDFTQSLYIALYFAIIDTKSDACIWAIDESWIRKKGGELANKNNFSLSNKLRFGEIDAMYNLSNFVININSFDGDGEEEFEHPAILLVELKRQIPRLAIQQGVFLMPTTLKNSFMDNLSFNQTSQDYPIVKKVIIPYDLRYEFLAQLKMMNITSESLFPGIDGFAKSLIHYDLL